MKTQMSLVENGQLGLIEVRDYMSTFLSKGRKDSFQLIFSLIYSLANIY